MCIEPVYEKGGFLILVFPAVLFAGADDQLGFDAGGFQFLDHELGLVQRDARVGVAVGN